jgi:DNA-binding transcriptional ArsR family regulator
MLRIHFTREDLTRIRVASRPDPAVETTLSLRTLRAAAAGPAARTWHAEVGRRLHPERVRPLLDLVPSPTYLPDFLDPTPDTDSGGHAISSAASTPKTVLREYLTGLAQHQPLTPAARRFANADSVLMRHLGAAVRHYHQAAIAPTWSQITARVHHDRALRGHTLLGGGITQLLNTLDPAIRLRGPVLEVALRGGHDLDVKLEGHGLVLQPSVFVGPSPVIWGLDDPRRPPLLVYPACRDGLATAPPGVRALPALIGRRRATVLAALAASPGLTTGELAQTIMSSPATASEHATVLRNAGLITTTRRRKAAVHVITSLGKALLHPFSE